MLRKKNKYILTNLSIAKSLRWTGLLFLFVLPAQAFQLEEIKALANGGASQLALQTMDRIQPDLLRDKKQWIEWEKARISIYQQSNNWQALAQRVDELPGRLPESFLRWIQTEQARAYIMLGKGEQALLVLQNLIWNLPKDNKSTIEEWLPQWRRLVINSYVNFQQSEDAQIAATRFYQGMTEQQLDDLLLRARIFLINNNADDAQTILGPHKDEAQVAMMYLLAQLRSQQLAPTKVVRQGSNKLKDEALDDELRMGYWAMMAEAAQRSGDRATKANALEHVLAEKNSTNLPDGLFDFNADSLWNSYIDYATWLGNRQQFLIGQDKQWFKAAEKAEKEQPVRARSFYALLMLQGQDTQFRTAATERFVSLLKKRDKGNEVLKQLFMQSKQFARLDTMPVEIRHVLVDVALAQSDIQQASKLMAGIKEPPAGSDNFFWHLRRARIFVLGSDAKRGIAALNKLVDSYAFLPKAQVDRLLQVVFDLQTVGEHQQAITLFNKILARTTEQQVQREIFFWLADSYKANKEYTQAARYYMKSATHLIEKNMDPWAQTSRYKAAEALAKAGYINDARTLFTQLLDITREPTRRAVLQHELQKLWLLKDDGPSRISNLQ